MQKKLLFFYATFFFVCLARAESFHIVTSQGYQGVVDENGELVIPTIYEHLGWSDGTDDIVLETIGYLENSRWGLINIQDRKVTAARYSILKPFAGECFEVGIHTTPLGQMQHGLIDRKGNTLLGIQYNTLESLGKDLLKLSEHKNGQLLFGLYSLESGPLITISYSSLNRVGHFILAGNRIKKYQVFDLKGKRVLDYWIDDLRRDFFSSGYKIYNEGMVGYLSSSGRQVHPPIYKTVDKKLNPVPFPKWELKALNTKEDTVISCDSVVFHPEDDILLAHVNDVSHILGASDALFKNQQHVLHYAGNGYIVTENTALGTWGLYKTDGHEVIAGFDSIVVDSAYFYAQSEEGWFIYNLFGRKLNEKPFEAVGYSISRNIPVKRSGLWGIVDFQGDPLIDFQFDEIRNVPFAGHFAVKQLNKWGVNALFGKWIVSCEYDEVEFTRQGYIAHRDQVNYVFGFSGDMIAKTNHLLTDVGFLKVEHQGHYGVITGSGILIEPIYEEVHRYGQFYELQSNEGAILIDQYGNEVIQLQDGIEDVLNYSEGYFLIKKDGKFGFVDENGKLRVANRYDAALPYHEGMAPISLLGKWGFIDKDEILVIQPYYKYSSTFDQGLAVVRLGENYGIIDEKGNEVLKPEWKYISRLSTGNYLVEDWDKKHGLVDARGNFIVSANYDQIKDTTKDLVIASRAGKSGVLDYKGFTKVPFLYREIHLRGEYLLLLKGQGKD